MQFKKLAAITGSALMAAMSLAGPVLATSVTQLDNISDMVGVTDSTVSFPLFVIGANAATSDVAGAVDVAVNMAANAKTTSQVAVEGAAVGITGGVSMATPTNPLTMWDNFASSKQVLTSSDLPTVLKSGSYVDAASVSSPYSQYLTFTNLAANGQIVYDTKSGGTSPELGLQFDNTNAVYTYRLAFTKQVSEAIATGNIANMVNTQLDMLGKSWTITGATVSQQGELALTLLSGRNAQTVTTDEAASYDVDGTSYTVELVAVGTINGVAAATVTVSKEGAAAETLQILTGGTKTLSDGTLIGVTSIFVTTKTGAIDSATVFIGADKLELEDMSLEDGVAYAGVKLNGETINDVTVSMIGNTTGTTGTLTLNTIEVTWTPSLEQFVTSGNSLNDPFTNGAWKIFFGGIVPALDDTANRETISVTPSGTAGAVGMKTSDGNSLNMNFVRSTSSGAGSVELSDAGSYDIHLVEGEAVGQNEYMVLGQNSLAGNAQNPFGHVIRVLSIQTASTSTSQFQDVATGTTLQVTGGNNTMYLDGQPYKVCVLSTSDVRFTWGTSADFCVEGAATDVYPAIQTSKGAWVSITNPVNITGLANNTGYTINLPTGSYAVLAGNLGNVSAAVPAEVGKAKFAISTNATGAATAWIAIKATDNAASATAYTTPGVLIVEGRDETQARECIAVRLDADGTVNRVDVPDGPAFTSSVTSTSGVSGTTQNKYVDQFGSYVTWDATMPGSMSVMYPASQAQAIVGVGASPAPSGGGTGGGTVTTETVLPITADVVKLDSEVTSTDKSGKDMVLVGGPCINSLVAELADAGTFPYSCADWPGSDFGKVQLVSDAFANGYTALVIAGTRAADTDLAARIVQTGFPGATDAQKAEDAIEVTGSVSSPAYS